MHNPRKPLRIASAAMFAASTAGVMAATVTKSDTSTMQAHATNWSAVPAAADIGSFNETLSAINATALPLVNQEDLQARFHPTATR